MRDMMERHKDEDTREKGLGLIEREDEGENRREMNMEDVGQEVQEQTVVEPRRAG
jgi:hypothetical protein